MNTKDAEKIISHLKLKWSGRSCPLCQVGPWEVQQSVFVLLKFDGGSINLGGEVVPVIPVTCKNCGNTILVNAIIANVLAPNAEDSAKEKK
jgi:hypothetical protein